MSEQFYDTEIAPKLLELCELCKARGIPFSATVEYQPDQRAQTRFLPDDSSLPMFMMAWLNHHGANVDGFMIQVLRHCRSKGIDWSQSMVLTKLGGAYSSST